MKKSLVVVACLMSISQLFSQIIFINSFGNLSLQTYTTTSSSVQYTTVPSSFTIINDGYKNNIGSITNPNTPFNVPSLKTEGWAVVYNSLEKDTFLVSTSWLDTTTVAVDRWLITPPISSITANTVLTWKAKSPDANYQENYAVYGTSKTGVLTSQDFAIGDQLFTTSAENSDWTIQSINIGSFTGQTLRFAFRDNSTDKYQVWIDDIEVITLPNALDGALTSLETSNYQLINTTQTISTTLTNLSAKPINSVTINYQIGNSTIQTEQITFTPPLNYNQSGLANFALPYSINSVGNYKLKTWISNVNSLQDQNQTNDTSFTYITVQNYKPKKNVFVEQFVSAFDGECVDAQEKLLALENDSVIVVNVHDQDSLKEANAFGILTAYKKNSATAMIDRTYFTTPNSVAVTRPYYDSLVAKQLRKVTPATVSIINKTYNYTTKELAFTVKADFIGDVKGDLRLNAYLTENNVHGLSSDNTLNGYNQLNNFYNVPWSPYYQIGSYFTNATSLLNAYQFKHQNTLVYSFDGSFGNTGTIPTTGGTQGQSYQKTYTLTVPTPTNGINKFNSDNLYLVGFLAEYSGNQNKRSILNVVKEKITTNSETAGIKNNSITDLLSIYPNPSTGTIFINMAQTKANSQIRVIDVMGRCVLFQNLSEINNPTAIDLSLLNDGVYFLQISSTDLYHVEKIVIQKN